MINYPIKIEKGDFIGITATSDGLGNQVDIDRLNNAIKYINNIGYNIKETLNTRNISNKLVSSDSKTRAKEFMELWQDKSIKCIAQVCGGEFLVDMLPFIDAKVITNNTSKWVFGYSDSSLLNFYLTTNYNISTLTCDNIISFGMEPIYESLLTILNALETEGGIIQENYKFYEKEKSPREQRTYNVAYNLTEQVEYKNLYNKKSDKIYGRLIGGCIDTLLTILGTPFDKTKDFFQQFDEGMIWYLENCGLSLPELYRGLWQMKQSGWFDNSNGFIIGRTRSQETKRDLEYLDVLHMIFDELNVPVIYDIDTGHVAPQWTMINGSKATFEYEYGNGKLIQHRI